MFKSPWSRRGGLAVAVVGSCAIAFRLGLPADTGQGMVEANGLAVPASSLDFGTVWETSAFHWYLPIQNRTRSDIHINEFEVSCNCIKVEPKQLLLQPGEKADVALTLDLTPRHYDEIGVAERPLRVQIRPHRLGDRFGSAWTLQGNVKSRLVLDTRALEFGEAPYDGGPPAWREVMATSFVPVRTLQVKAEPALALVEVAPVAPPAKRPVPAEGRALAKPSARRFPI
ncbi:MAG TPA: DUF1573 domain-containing protein [Gemmataceae bacterium]|nr:DUF1573 domain-containing protein [Gemmataceae bacterium]